MANTFFTELIRIKSKIKKLQTLDYYFYTPEEFLKLLNNTG